MNLSKWILIALLIPTIGCDLKGSDDDDDDDDEESTYGSETGGGNGWATGSGGGSTDGGETGSGGGTTGGGSTGGGEAGGDETGGSTTGGSTSGGSTGGDDLTGGSCLIGTSTCYEPNEPNNEEWCFGMGGTYYEDDCEDGAFASCEVPPGGDFSAPATAYFYGEFDAETACNEAGGDYIGPSTSPDHDHDHDHDDTGAFSDWEEPSEDGGSSDGGWSGGGSSDGGSSDGGWSGGGSSDGGWSGGGSSDGGGSGDASTGGDDAPIGLEEGDSCSFGDSICIETTEDDDEMWCDSVGGSYEPEDCSLECTTGMCRLPPGGDYTSPADVFYSGSIDGESVCSSAGGVYEDLTEYMDEDCFESSGAGTFEIDTLYVMWEGAYRDGAAVTATYDDDGTLEEYPNTFSLIWIDSLRYSAGSEDYICRLNYDSTGATVADFSEFDGADLAYMTFLMDLGASTPETSGDCEGAASAFGVEDMEAVAEDTPWGFGYGPMTYDFEEELIGIDDVDYESLGDRPGVTYLRWQNEDGDKFTAWGYFQVIPFMSDSTTMLDLPIEDPSDFISGVRDSMIPADGLYYQETVYILTYGG